MENSDEQAQLDQLKKGDSHTYELIFKKYYRQLNLEAFSILKDTMEAEDQVQSLFIEVWDKKLYRNINISIRAYLHTSVRNRCFNVIEKRKTSQKKLNQSLHACEQQFDNNLLEQREASMRMDTILSKVPRQRMQAFSLVYLEEKKYKDAAAEMGITINSVKTHLKLAIKELRQRFVKFN